MRFGAVNPRVGRSFEFSGRYDIPNDRNGPRLGSQNRRSGPRRTRGHRPHIGAAATPTRRAPRARATQPPRRRTRSRRRRHAGHGGLLRPLWHHQIVLLLATDAPPIRREAWATLQEWAVCSSIFVVGLGVKAGRAGSTRRDTLNARSERVPVAQAEWSQNRFYLRRVPRRRAGCAAATALSGRRRAHTSMEKTATAAQSRRRSRGVHALVST